MCILKQHYSLETINHHHHSHQVKCGLLIHFLTTSKVYKPVFLFLRHCDVNCDVSNFWNAFHFLVVSNKEVNALGHEVHSTNIGTHIHPLYSPDISDAVF